VVGFQNGNELILLNAVAAILVEQVEAKGHLGKGVGVRGGGLGGEAWGGRITLAKHTTTRRPGRAHPPSTFTQAASTPRTHLLVLGGPSKVVQAQHNLPDVD
jgi:hypothetical protein